MTFLRPPADDSDGIALPSPEEVETALSQAPDDLTWDWVLPRLIPLFERGYTDGITGDPLVNSVSHLGIGIGYGIDFGPVFGRVTQGMAERWEASVEQIEHAAFSRLADVSATVGRADLQSVVHRGHFFRALGRPGGWASSIVLAGESELARIFGTGDAIFSTPARSSLLAFAPATPARVVAEVTFQLENGDPHPLGLDPFVMEDGVLHWQGLDTELDGVI
ncbi:MAG: hypothetical protein ACRDE6_00450 [Candidatus Limnocylindria bacterium]